MKGEVRSQGPGQMVVIATLIRRRGLERSIVITLQGCFGARCRRSSGDMPRTGDEPQGRTGKSSQASCGLPVQRPR